MSKLEDTAGDLVTALAAAFGDDVTPVLIPGQVLVTDFVWPNCDQAWVRLDSLFPSSQFPIPDNRPTACATPVAMRWHVGIARCVNGLDENGQSPDAPDQAADSLQIMGDAMTIRTMLCELSKSAGRGESLLGAWQPMGPLGNTAGGWWPWTVRW